MQRTLKRTTTVTFEITHYQRNQLKALGHKLWPDRNLSYQEICRRVLLDGADRRMARSAGERLLEPGCEPAA